MVLMWDELKCMKCKCSTNAGPCRTLGSGEKMREWTEDVRRNGEGSFLLDREHYCHSFCLQARIPVDTDRVPSGALMLGFTFATHQRRYREPLCIYLSLRQP